MASTNTVPSLHTHTLSLPLSHSTFLIFNLFLTHFFLLSISLSFSLFLEFQFTSHYQRSHNSIWLDQSGGIPAARCTGDFPYIRFLFPFLFTYCTSQESLKMIKILLDERNVGRTVLSFHFSCSYQTFPIYFYTVIYFLLM